MSAAVEIKDKPGKKAHVIGYGSGGGADVRWRAGP